MDNALIGERIRQARLKAELTQEDLGNKTGFSQKTISLLERGGIGAVTIETLEAIARATRHPLSFFVTDIPRSKATVAEVLRQQYPDLEEATLREIQSFISWAVDRDRAMHTARNARSGAASGGHTSDTGESEEAKTST